MANTRNRTLGDLIREARVKKGVTLRSFADKFGKSASYISDIENDRRVPAEPLLRDICREIHLNFDDAMGLAGRIGDDAERELRRTPQLGLLFRKMSDLPASDRETIIQKYLREVETKLKR
jgi:transcriptional regulator with XRE-family HTH domain